MKALQKNIPGLLMAQKTAEDIFFFSYITVKKILSVKDCITYIHPQTHTHRNTYIVLYIAPEIFGLLLPLA